jgi:hypothetical protein
LGDETTIGCISLSLKMLQPGKHAECNPIPGSPVNTLARIAPPPPQVRTDPLQRLHTLHNLAETLDSLARKHAAAAAAGAAAAAPPPVARTLRDGSLWGEAKTLRDGYLAARVADLSAQRAAYAKAREAAAGGKKKARRLAAAGGGPGRGRGGRGGSAGRGAAAGSGVREFAEELAQALTAGDGAGDGGGQQEENEDDEEEVEEVAVAEAVAAAAQDAWYVKAIDALERTGKGEEVSDAVRDALMESDRYNRRGAQNATSMARRCVLALVAMGFVGVLVAAWDWGLMVG